jgi:hypothetical protein
LESQDSAVRRNDIRLGKMVVTTDSVYNRIGIQNVRTKERTYIGNPQDAVFSYSGVVGEGSVSPPHLLPQTTVARELAVGVLAGNTSTVDTVFTVYFNDAELGVTITLPANQTVGIRGINVPIGMNQNIYVVCTDTNATDTPPIDPSVFVRFGAAASLDLTETEV